MNKKKVFLWGKKLALEALEARNDERMENRDEKFDILICETIFCEQSLKNEREKIFFELLKEVGWEWSRH